MALGSEIFSRLTQLWDGRFGSLSKTEEKQSFWSFILMDCWHWKSLRMCKTLRQQENPHPPPTPTTDWRVCVVETFGKHVVCVFTVTLHSVYSWYLNELGKAFFWLKLVVSYRSEVKARQDVKPDICQPPYTDYRQPPVDYRHPPVADYRQPPTMDYRHPPPLIDYRQHSIPDYRPQVGLQTQHVCV